MKKNPCMNIVFYEPEIPQNTGSTARLCAATGATLHLVGKLGFRTDAAAVKRAGLDYWKHVTVREYPDFDALRQAAGPDASFWFLSKKADKIYTEANFSPGDYLVFGPETRGLPESLTAPEPERCLRIPINNVVRSLNLATAAGIVLYEALRQNGWPDVDRAFKPGPTGKNA